MKLSINKEFGSCLECPFASMEFTQNNSIYKTDESNVTFKQLDYSNGVYVCLFSNRYIPNQCLMTIPKDCPLISFDIDFVKKLED